MSAEHAQYCSPALSPAGWIVGCCLLWVGLFLLNVIETPEIRNTDTLHMTSYKIITKSMGRTVTAGQRPLYVVNINAISRQLDSTRRELTALVKVLKSQLTDLAVAEMYWTTISCFLARSF